MPAGKSRLRSTGRPRPPPPIKDGRWEVTLDPMRAGGPLVLELDGRPAAYDVMVGDVWLCSGQSNMEMGIDKLHGIWGHAPEVLAEANHPQIRLWHASKQFSPKPMHSYVIRQNVYLAEYQAEWNVCTPDTIARGAWGGFSALGYFFGREIQADQKVAVGLMQVAHGGTAIEAWMSAEALREDSPGPLGHRPHRADGARQGQNYAAAGGSARRDRSHRGVCRSGSPPPTANRTGPIITPAPVSTACVAPVFPYRPARRAVEPGRTQRQRPLLCGQAQESHRRLAGQVAPREPAVHHHAVVQLANVR